MLPQWNILGGLAAGAFSGVVDLISGASKKRKRAQDSYLGELGRQSDRLTGEIGPSATQSTGFKANKSLLDQTYGEQSKAMDQGAAASGATPEAQLGARDRLNMSYNRGILGALSNAENERRQLMRMRDDLLLQRYASELGIANQGLDAQQMFTSGISTILPYLFDDLMNKDTGSTDTSPDPNSVSKASYKYDWFG